MVALSLHTQIQAIPKALVCHCMSILSPVCHSIDIIYHSFSQLTHACFFFLSMTFAELIDTRYICMRRLANEHCECAVLQTIVQDATIYAIVGSLNCMCVPVTNGLMQCSMYRVTEVHSVVLEEIL